MTWTCGSRKGRKHLQYLNTSHNMTVKMSVSEWPRALAHSWIVALRVNRRCGNGPPEAAEERSRSDTTTEEETHDAFDRQQVRNAQRHRDHASVFWGIMSDKTAVEKFLQILLVFDVDFKGIIQ